MTEINILYSHITDVYNSSIPKRIGAYVITHTFDNIHAEKYVGSTKNLFKRMHGHCNKEIRSIGYLNKKAGTKHIGIPDKWGNSGDKVLIETINEKELKMRIVD